MLCGALTHCRLSLQEEKCVELAISINTDAVIKGVLIFAEQLFESSESRSVGYSPLLSALYSVLWRGSLLAL